VEQGAKHSPLTHVATTLPNHAARDNTFLPSDTDIKYR
jgi:hypothetical protein